MKRPLAFIIEDDIHLCQIYAKALAVDFETEIANDGSTALMRLEQIIPEVILLDLNLPGLGGKDILADIRSTPNLKNAHVILCTADSQQASLLQEQADIVMLKPVSPAQLRQVAARFV